ncbi:hypothetical protein L7F22_026567 [Adiantum nelumboides]|nr:hypothetical protein [Adiantum nelumboides]
MAPALYLPLRSSSSTRARLPAAPHATSSSSSGHRHAPAAAPAPKSALPSVAAAVAPHGQLPFPAFHTSSHNILVPAATASAPYPRNAKRELGGAVTCLGDVDPNSPLNYSSSGSLHVHAHDHEDPNSVCLAAMVDQFLEEEGKLTEEKEEEEDVGASMSPTVINSGCGRARCNCVDGVCGDEFRAIVDEDDDDESNVLAQVEILQGYNNSSTKAERLLRMQVERAYAEEVTHGGDHDIGVLAEGRDGIRRRVMRRLRDVGYNAAACKSRWNHGSGLPAGDYEYIDVLPEGSKLAGAGMAASSSSTHFAPPPAAPVHRLIVDIDFRAQFEIARPSREYSRLLEAVPRVFVGRAEQVKQVVRMMSQAAKRSLRVRGLMVPPWRKQRYMQAKWLSPIYRRTTNCAMEPAQLISSRTITNTQQPVGKRIQGELYRGRLYDLLMREEASDALMYIKARPLDSVGKCRDVCTAMCTSWRLPPLESTDQKRANPALRASALSVALQNTGRAEPALVSVFS